MADVAPGLSASTCPYALRQNDPQHHEHDATELSWCIESFDELVAVRARRLRLPKSRGRRGMARNFHQGGCGRRVETWQRRRTTQPRPVAERCRRWCGPPRCASRPCWASGSGCGGSAPTSRGDMSSSLASITVTKPRRSQNIRSTSWTSPPIRCRARRPRPTAAAGRAWMTTPRCCRSYRTSGHRPVRRRSGSRRGLTARSGRDIGDEGAAGAHHSFPPSSPWSRRPGDAGGFGYSARPHRSRTQRGHGDAPPSKPYSPTEATCHEHPQFCSGR